MKTLTFAIIAALTVLSIKPVFADFLPSGISTTQEQSSYDRRGRHKKIGDIVSTDRRHKK